jgi:hypothetical protein
MNKNCNINPLEKVVEEPRSFTLWTKHKQRASPYVSFGTRSLTISNEKNKYVLLESSIGSIA